MAAASKKRKAHSGTRPEQHETKRLWLMYPARLITTPVIWQLGQKFKVVTNVRQASVTDEIGIVCLELAGQRAVIKEGIKWLEKMGVSVEPVEINVIES
ncbi:MAG: NIL domain-containing protein [Verrucomicrobia bacterium]|nr:NIL domain-containing protein [Verrucomicrobiota bacterium]